MNEKELLRLADLYLAGVTTLEQERTLREALLQSDSDDPRVEEVLAVMSFAAESGRLKAAEAVAPRRRLASWQMMAAAAAVAALLSVGAWISRVGGSKPDDCSAVIACVTSNETSVAMSLMESQLCDIAAASDKVDSEIASDFASLREAINEI